MSSTHGNYSNPNAGVYLNSNGRAASRILANGSHMSSTTASSQTTDTPDASRVRELAPGVAILDEPAAGTLYRQSHSKTGSPQPAPDEGNYDPHFEQLISQIITRLGEDPERDGLKRTPLRVAKALDFLTSGYTADLAEVVNDAVFEDDGEEMVLVKDIEFYSLCEHHLLPFFGRIHIAYIPNRKIIGLSKLARVADVFARRLQVQERLTNQIADALVELLEPRGVAVVAEAAHFCMMMRGVQKQNSSTMTSALRGIFKTDLLQRDQFMRMIGK